MPDRVLTTKSGTKNLKENRKSRSFACSAFSSVSDLSFPSIPCDFSLLLLNQSNLYTAACCVCSVELDISSTLTLFGFFIKIKINSKNFKSQSASPTPTYQLLIIVCVSLVSLQVLFVSCLVLFDIFL